MDLSALAGLDVSGIESLDEPTERSQFPDEIEATAPARELPADLTAQQLQFVESLDVIYTVLHDADMLGQSIRSVMQELQENKEFIQLVSDHDIHTMIKARSEEHTSELQSLMRISYAVFCLHKKNHT